MTSDSGSESGAENQPLVRELLWIHGIIRDNLAQIALLAEQVRGGASAAVLQAQVSELASASILWTLRSGCLRYCGLVHAHHQGEDTHFFPGLRRVNPALCPVIDKLEADHIVVAKHLDAVEEAARRIVSDEAERENLVAALNELSAHLITHLDYEEAQLTPTLSQLSDWPMP